jgi:hypothetical protein
MPHQTASIPASGYGRLCPFERAPWRDKLKSGVQARLERMTESKREDIFVGTAGQDFGLAPSMCCGAGKASPRNEPSSDI